MKYKISVTYGEHSRPLASSPPGGSQEHDLEEDAAKAAMEKFIQDMWRFHGSGIRKITIEALPG